MLGQLSELSAPVRFSIAVPTQMQRTGRIFKVLTMHDGQTFELRHTLKTESLPLKRNAFRPLLVYGTSRILGGQRGAKNKRRCWETIRCTAIRPCKPEDKAGMLVYLAGAVLSAAAAAGLWILRKKRQHKAGKPSRSAACCAFLLFARRAESWRKEKNMIY